MKNINQGLKEEKGAALVTALLFLVMLTLLGIFAIWTSSTETALGGNERLNKQAYYLAESGIQEAISRLDVSDMTNVYYYDTAKGTVGTQVTSPLYGWVRNATPWQRSFKRTDGFTNYSVIITPFFEDDTPDSTFHIYTSSLAPTNQMILYNEGFKYTDAPLSGSNHGTNGFPVFRIVSIGKVRGPDGRVLATAKIQADVTKNTINMNTPGGLAANGCTNIGGSSLVSAPSGDVAVSTTCMTTYSSTNITGEIKKGVSMTNMSSFLGIDLYQLKQMATISYTGGSTENSVSWGNYAGETEPQIIFVDNACKYSGAGCSPGTFHLTGNGSGYGILVVTGDFKIDGTFNFKGLVYVLGDFETQGTGGSGAHVTGSVMCGGNVSYTSAVVTGNSSITLDRTILEKVAKAGFTSKIIVWKEIREP